MTDRADGGTPARIGRREVLAGATATAGLLGYGVIQAVRGESIFGWDAFVDEPFDRIDYGDAESQFGDFYDGSGDGPWPTVVVMHGGSWSDQLGLEYMRPVAESLVKRGWAVWNIEYRRLGEPGSGWPGTFDDVAAATDHLAVLARERPIDLERTTLLGHSAGGQLALWAAGRERLPNRAPGANPKVSPMAVASLAGVTDLTRCAATNLLNDGCARLLGGSPTEVPERYQQASPQDRTPLGLPQLIAHGRLDEVVPFSYSESYVQLARSNGDDVRFLELENANHFDLVDVETQPWRRIAGAFDKWRR